jgi:mannose-6-phosphate isomerase class I
VQVANLDSLPQIRHSGGESGLLVELVRSVYFTTLLYQLNAQNGTWLDASSYGRFHILTCIEGQVRIEWAVGSLTLPTGRSALIPACMDTYALNGTARVLCSFQTE